MSHPDLLFLGLFCSEGHFVQFRMGEKSPDGLIYVDEMMDSKRPDVRNKMFTKTYNMEDALTLQNKIISLGYEGVPCLGMGDKPSGIYEVEAFD